MSHAGNRIGERFAALEQEGYSAFIPYITAGDPNLRRTEEIVGALAEAGADIVELGVPFSDPIGDGPVNQEAAQRALQQGVTLDGIFGAIRNIRKVHEIPIVLFTYFNPILAHGIKRFAQEAAEAGADGVLCVDLPPDEAEEYTAVLAKAGLRTVFLAAPTSTDARIAKIAEASTGFIYYVSQMGVTGARQQLSTDLGEMLSRIKRHTEKPVAVGFGISTPEQAETVAGLADGVVVGSAIVRLVAEHGDSDETAAAVGAFAKELVAAVRKHRRSAAGAANAASD